MLSLLEVEHCLGEGSIPDYQSQINSECQRDIIGSQTASAKIRSRKGNSYLQVRLEFLRYPQVIQALFNVPWFGPPVRLTAPSTCSWVGHMVSGLRHDTKAPYSDSVSLRLRLFNLTSHHIVTRRFILQKARSHPLTGSNLL